MKTFFIRLLDAIQTSRQDKIHREIAYHLWTSEYKHESYDYILTMVKMGKADQLGMMVTK